MGVIPQSFGGVDRNLPAPMNWYSKHIRVTSDVPIFCTGPHMIRWYTVSPDEIRTSKHENEDLQIELCWKTFEFTHRFTDADRIDDIGECPSCFARLTLLGTDE